jgi:hypothetical protein
MKKLLFVAPHLSTGGQPQYLLKKIKALNDEYEIHCVEYNDHTGGVLIVQREQVQKLCGERFYVLDNNKNKLLEIIEKVNPDIIHFEEMPEYFMDMNLAFKIYKKDRYYKIIETSHDSSFNSDRKRVFPDQFIFVSNYQKQNVESLNIESDVIEYPIAVKLRKNRDEGLKFLGLDINKKHVFHVGLFTPRKNQKEFIDYARAMENENVQFHCIGNMADNFKFYWEPLLKNLPKNVKVWGERKDVDNFYSCMDLFLFTSRGHATDKETAPIVIKESISFNVPSLLYNLPVYLDKYNKFDNINYLDEYNFQKNVNLIKRKLGFIESDDVILKKDKKDIIVIISTHPNHISIENATKMCIEKIKKSGYKVLLTSHYPVSNSLQNLVDYYVFDKNNPILKHNFYNQWHYSDLNFSAKVNFAASDNDDYHGLAVHLNYFNGISYAKSLGFKKSICLNYDVIVDESDFSQLEKMENVLEKKDAFFFYNKASEGDTLKTVLFSVNNDFYLKRFKYYSPIEYMNIVYKFECSNGLEQFYFNILKDYKDFIFIDYQHNEETFLKNSKLNAFSMVEYLTVLPNKKNNQFVIFSVFSNKVDDRINNMIVKENEIVVDQKSFDIKNNNFYYLSHPFKENCEYEIESVLTDNKNNILKRYIKKFKTTDDIDINGYIDFKK